MKKYSASITIKASAEKIWSIITDAGSYPEWDLSMDHIEGKLALGETVTFLTKLSPNSFPVKVTGFEPNRKLVLTGGMPLGLFKSERTHTLAANKDGSTTFHTEEIFSGLLLPIFGKNIPNLTENFQGFVAALKKKAEG
ncbi:MAG: SRPBCC domain-containing protein [Chloroflexi bacterium]|nr:MAG: SRPBCC domain-containing protein [Chloroflexota bacterium]MCE7859532.1 SRPBCC domain-containing protein [Chloroflexi bacterium CFX2]